MAAYGSPNVISQESPRASRPPAWRCSLTQGINGLPVYDLNNASYVMTFGGNLLETSRHVIGYLGAVAFMRRGRPQRGKLVAVTPPVADRHQGRRVGADPPGHLRRPGAGHGERHHQQRALRQGLRPRLHLRLRGFRGRRRGDSTRASSAGA